MGHDKIGQLSVVFSFYITLSILNPFLEANITSSDLGHSKKYLKLFVMNQQPFNIYPFRQPPISNNNKACPTKGKGGPVKYKCFESLFCLNIFELLSGWRWCFWSNPKFWGNVCLYFFVIKICFIYCMRCDIGRGQTI